MKVYIALVALALLMCVGSLAAQTSTDLNEGSRVSKNATTGQFTFSWWGKAGRTYFVQQSSDLINWSYMDAIDSGTGAVLQRGFSSAAPRLFLRLPYTDIATNDAANADFDGDGINNLWELQHGTDPLSATSKGSMVPDGWASGYGLEPAADTSLDGNNHLVYSYDNANRIVGLSAPTTLPVGLVVDAEGNVTSVSQ